MDIKLVKELVSEFKGCDLTRIKVKSDDFELELERLVTTQATTVPAVIPQVATAQINIGEPIGEECLKQGEVIKAPMVGTFYRSSAPDQPPFVEIGSKVKKGDIVCIIEAMKLMNEVEADKDGEIIEILAQNEEMVEFDQPLFRIK